MSNRILRRPRGLSRPVAVAIAAVVGLGGLGGAAGALLGELGGTGAGVHQTDGGHHVDRFDTRFGNDGNGIPGSGPLR